MLETFNGPGDMVEKIVNVSGQESYIPSEELYSKLGDPLLPKVQVLREWYSILSLQRMGGLNMFAFKLVNCSQFDRCT